MALKESLRPKSHARVIDLVSEANIDTSDWANFSGGQRRASVNPKYCYEWAFRDALGNTVLSLWHEELIEEGDTLFHRSNFRPHVYVGHEGRTPWNVRAGRLDAAVLSAWKEGRPVRVMLNEGRRRQEGNSDQRAASVKYRLLDPEAWWVSKYDEATGDHELSRGKPVVFVDQFTASNEQKEVERRQRMASSYVRCREVREAVLRRANGECEFCHEPGFELPDGRLYLETHHIDALCRKGRDEIENVIALCPNHHREAHYGSKADEITERLKAIIAEL